VIVRTAVFLALFPVMSAVSAADKPTLSPLEALAAEPDTSASTADEMNGDTETLRKQIDWYRDELVRQKAEQERYEASIARHKAELAENRDEQARLQQEISRLRNALGEEEQPASE
jgi:septal ring factor EnvC (AmiA/AmiB activator)